MYFYFRSVIINFDNILDDEVQIIADYKVLNGDAHRTMSCAKRDALDEVNNWITKLTSLLNSTFNYDFNLDIFQAEFDRWEVSKSLREIVKNENVRHELTLLDIQEKKVLKKWFSYDIVFKTSGSNLNFIS